MTQPKFDQLIHSKGRLQLCAILDSVTSADFSVLREELDVSDSVLSKHLKALEDAGYVKVNKHTVASRVRTWISLTRNGKKAFAGHVAELNRIVSPKK